MEAVRLLWTSGTTLAETAISPADGWVCLGGVWYFAVACGIRFGAKYLGNYGRRGRLLLGAYRKVDGQNRLVTSLMTSRDPMTSQQ